MSKPLKPIPAFTSEAEERAFWETHDSADFVDWSKARRAVLPNLPHSHAPRGNASSARCAA